MGLFLVSDGPGGRIYYGFLICPEIGRLFGVRVVFGTPNATIGFSSV